MNTPLRIPGHERFAQELAKGRDQKAAWRKAGYKGGPAVASRIAAREDVKARVAFLMGKAAEKAVIDAAWVLEKAVDLHEKAKAANAFAPAARALELVGKHVEVQAFREQLNHTGMIEYRNLSDEEIAARIAAHEAARAAHPTTH